MTPSHPATGRKTVLYNSPYLGVGAIKWIISSWEEGFKRAGYDFHVCDDPRQFSASCARLHPDVVICDIVSTFVEHQDVRDELTRIRKAGAKVCMNVFWPLADQPLERAEALMKFDVADIYMGEREPDSMEGFVAECGKKYYTMPQAANPRFHQPAEMDKRYTYDVVFMGAKLPHKRWFNENIIPQLRKKHRLGLFGPGWTVKDNCLRAGSKLARLAGRRSIARFFDQFRVQIPEEDENKLYSSTKISLNFHERETDLRQPHHIVNQRTFKIAACGGFQIVDPVAAIPKYFAQDEIVTAGFEPRDWLDRVEYYLKHEDERRAIQIRGTARAQREHMAHHRVHALEKVLAEVQSGQT